MAGLTLSVELILDSSRDSSRLPFFPLPRIAVTAPAIACILNNVSAEVLRFSTMEAAMNKGEAIGTLPHRRILSEGRPEPAEAEAPDRFGRQNEGSDETAGPG